MSSRQIGPTDIATAVRNMHKGDKNQLISIKKNSLAERGPKTGRCLVSVNPIITVKKEEKEVVKSFENHSEKQAEAVRPC